MYKERKFNIKRSSIGPKEKFQYTYNFTSPERDCPRCHPSCEGKTFTYIYLDVYIYAQIHIQLVVGVKVNIIVKNSVKQIVRHNVPKVVATAINLVNVVIYFVLVVVLDPLKKTV